MGNKGDSSLQILLFSLDKRGRYSEEGLIYFSRENYLKMSLLEGIIHG